MVEIAPYGTWVSPVTLDMATGQMMGFRELRGDHGTVLWLESRPAEAGRTTLMRMGLDNQIVELTPAPFDVGDKVHEYGGGAYAAYKETVIFSHRKDGSLWLIEKDAPQETSPRPITQVSGCRYADFSFGLAGRFVLAVREDHRIDGKEPKAAIVAIDISNDIHPATNEGMALIEGPDFLSSPVLSPDGRKLAWISWNHPDMPWDASKLMQVPVDFVDFPKFMIGAPKILAGKMREACVQPSWSPAGVLHFCTDRTGFWNVYRYVEETSRICTTREEVGGPHWVFGQRYYDFESESSLIAISSQGGTTEATRIRQGVNQHLPIGQIAECPVPLPGGSIAYIANPPDAPPAIMLKPEGANPRAIRISGDIPLKPDDISPGKPVVVPLSNGQTGNAVWYQPVNSAYAAPEGELCPMIVLCHGGPTAMAGTGFSMKVQWWTSRGFAVLDVNYGGSTGFGRTYRERLQGKWGQVDVSDCIDAARHMADAGYVDKRRMVIRGSSAGGLTVLSALAKTDLFRAGSSLYGVTDLVTLAKETHKFEAHYLDWLIGEPATVETAYRARSPVTMAQNIRSPVIFFQGLDDKVVPPEQARSMAKTISSHGVAAPLHEFEGEGHGFRKPETQRTLLGLETAFYGKVLGFRPAPVS